MVSTPSCQHNSAQTLSKGGEMGNRGWRRNRGLLKEQGPRRVKRWQPTQTDKVERSDGSPERIPREHRSFILKLGPEPPANLLPSVDEWRLRQNQLRPFTERRGWRHLFSRPRRLRRRPTGWRNRDGRQGQPRAGRAAAAVAAGDGLVPYSMTPGPPYLRRPPPLPTLSCRDNSPCPEACVSPIRGRRVWEGP